MKLMHNSDICIYMIYVSKIWLNVVKMYMAAKLFLSAIFSFFAEFYDIYTHLCNLYMYIRIFI